MKDKFIIIDSFKPGWHRRVADSRIPLGGSKISSNIMITDREGISPRPGEELLGDETSGDGGKSLFTFGKSDGVDLLMRSFGTQLDFFSNKKEKWGLIKTGYTSGQVFGFGSTRVDVTDTLDWISYANGVDAFERWCGFDSYLASTLVGGETEVVVDTVLQATAHETNTASASTTTTIDIADTEWSADIWDGFYVRITSGVKEGYISLITATTSSQITFDAIAGLSGTPTFEIRLLAVPATGTLVYNGSTVDYTGVTRDDRFDVASAHAGTEDDVLTVAPTVYPENPRGNIFEVKDEALYVAGYDAAPVTVSRSHVADLDNFEISSPRAANEGDLVYFPYGGRYITDLKGWEDWLVVAKPDSLSTLAYTDVYDESVGATTDVSEKKILKQGVSIGSVGRMWGVGDDLMFVTSDRRITTLGRVLGNDTRPLTTDIAYPIRREVKNYAFDDVAGLEHIDKAYIACKISTDVENNNRILIWNKDHEVWDGYWNIQSNGFTSKDGDLYYIDSYSPDVYKMLTGVNKRKGEDFFPMTCKWRSGWINGRGSAFYLNEVSSLAVEGRIKLNSTIDVKLFKDHSEDSFLEIGVNAIADSAILDGSPAFSILGGESLGIDPLGASFSIGDEEDDGYRHFVVFIQFKTVQVESIAIEFGSSGTNQAWEVLQAGINATENVFEAQSRIIGNN